jgi:hypothetical protein
MLLDTLLKIEVAFTKIHEIGSKKTESYGIKSSAY